MTFEDLINGTLHILIQQPREEGRKTGALLDVRNGPIVNYQSWTLTWALGCMYFEIQKV